MYEPAGSKPNPWATNPDPRTTSRTTSPATLDVARASTKVTLSSSRNPSIQGQEVTFTAVVSPELGGVSTGTVVFFKDGDDTPLTAIDLGVVNGNSVAIFTTPELPTGVHKLFVEYAGDTNCVGSRSAGSPLIQAVKARGQDMEQKAADEFAGGEGHRSRLR